MDDTARTDAGVSDDATDGASRVVVSRWADAAVGRLVPLAPATLGAAMTCLALAHLTAVESGLGSVLSAATGTAGLALGICAVLWRRATLRPHTLHAILSGCLVLAAADGLMFAWISENLERTADLMLVVVAAGLALLDRRWYRATITVVALGWLGLAAGSGATRGYQLLALTMSLALGAAARSARLASLDAVQRLETRANLAVVDPLTGLPDRRGVQLVAAQLLAIARRESGAVGCTVVAIDGFDEVADTQGPEVADALLVHLATVLSSVVRATDVVARWAPSQFVVVSHGVGAPMEVLEQRIASRVDKDCPVEPGVWDRTLLLGRAVLQPWDDGGLATTLEQAERDLYQRAGMQPPPASAAARAEEATARTRRLQAQTGQAVSEVIAEASAVQGELVDLGGGRAGQADVTLRRAAGPDDRGPAR